MLKRIKEDWRFLGGGRPGERFQRLYRKRQASGKSRIARPAVILAGSVIVVAGIVFLPLAGPGTLIILAGGALLASESRLAARALDAGEVKTRKLLEALLRFWRRAPIHVRAGVVIGAFLLLASTGFAVYKLVQRTVLAS